ncbi:MAG: cytochrome P460 family protein [Pseudomonadales bacterium]|nr:cytochrome P460 family protein [Pseudomonadales bacterium]
MDGITGIAWLVSKMKGYDMIIFMCRLAILMSFFFCVTSSADEFAASTYKKIVDTKGNISLPKNFHSDWAFLGAWSIAMKEVDLSGAASGHGAAGLHNVYTQRGVAEYYRQNKKFPDGAVFVKELLKTATDTMTTGTVSRGSEVEGWFIMVKDSKKRFSANPLWGDGWGWALIKADKPKKVVTQDYKKDCLGCHIPARNDDWIYLSGYPMLLD